MVDISQKSKFSVLLSVYFKETPEFFDRSLESIYNQTVKAAEWVIVKDGEISQDLQSVIDKYKQFDDISIKEIQLEHNMGLGVALSIGVPQCSYDFIARMDTDDIAVENRFELQIAEFERNPQLDICGGQILEFEDDENVFIGERNVPITHDEIVKYQKKRTAFNHMSVMFKKEKVLEAGNYKNMPYMEDDMLWVDMILHGAICSNLKETLCLVRTNRDMIARRGGIKYYKCYKKERKEVYKSGFITYGQYLLINTIQLCVCLMPKSFRKIVFFKLLHKKRETNKG